MLDDALAVHRSRLNTAAGGAAVYVRASFRIRVPVVLGQTVFSDEQADLDSYADIKSVDFLIAPSDLKLGNDLLEPQRGDRIEYDGEIFDLMAGTGGSAWSWSDSRKTFYRLHTIRRGHVESQ